LLLFLSLAGAALAFVTTVFSVFTDSEKPEKAGQRKGLLLLAGLALLVAVVSEIRKSKLDAQAAAEREAEFSRTSGQLASQSEQLARQSKALSDQTGMLVSQHSELMCAVMRSHGAADCRALDSAEQNQVLAANRELQRSSGESFDVVVQYFSKDLDPQRLDSALSNAGFTKVQRKPASESMSRFATDSIFFGPRVPTAAVRNAALTLMTAGVQLYQIKCEPTLGKTLQIGAEARLSHATPLTPSALDDAIAKARCA
jgi:hypothetical protein